MPAGTFLLVSNNGYYRGDKNVEQLDNTFRLPKARFLDARCGTKGAAMYFTLAI